MRRAARVDNSHGPILDTLKDASLDYKDVSGLPNFCDILVFFRGETHHIEAKSLEYASKDQKEDRELMLTKGERKHREMCIRNSVPHHIVFDGDEVLSAIGLTT